jgi:hypothetical protein
MDRNGQFRSDIAGEATIDRTAIEAVVAGPDDRLTFMCAPWGSGVRIAIDRDQDSVLNGDEIQVERNG